jgi:hypothetical protein
MGKWYKKLLRSKIFCVRSKFYLRRKNDTKNFYNA